MRRVRWKRKDAFVQTCSKRKFGECGSQLFCPKTYQSLRSTGRVRSLSSLVRRADRHMKPRGANRTPSASLSAAAPAHLQSRAVRSEAERTGVEIRRFSFAPRCATGFLVRGCSSGWSRYSAAGRRLPDLVGSAWRPAPVLGELTVSSVNSSLTFFLFHRARRIFFLMSQKENGGCVPAVVCRVPLRSKENVRNIPMGKAHLGLQFRMASPCSPAPQSGAVPSQFLNQFIVNQKEQLSWQSI